MKCKNKEVIVRGTVSIDGSVRLAVGNLRCICTNGEIFKGDYRKCH